jgi:hypothetical protein
MKTIVEMTREAGGFDATPEFLERFADLVRADEREACARLAEEVVDGKRWFNDLPSAIRARGNT